MVVFLVAGLPYLLIVVAGSPIPHDWPTWEEITSAFSRRDDGTLLLGTLRLLSWLLWGIWTGLLILEAALRLFGRVAPRIPGLEVPQSFAALLITSLGATVISMSVTLSRASALPPPASDLATSTAPVHPAHAGSDEGSSSADGQGDRSPPAHQDVLSAQAVARPELGDDRPVATQINEATPAGRRSATVRFGFDSAGLTTEARAALMRAARDINEHADPGQPVTIAGYTDSLGEAEYNRRLSLRRAHAARDALRSTLARTYQMHTIGKGENQPVAQEGPPGVGGNAAARARNRRVEVTYILKAEPAPSIGPTRPGRPDGQSESVGPGAATPTVPVAPTATSSPTYTPSAPTTPEQKPSRSPAPTSKPVTIELPSGAVVGLSFATGVGSALVITRLHRRRRHRTPRRGPDPNTREPGSPELVRRLRQADLAAKEAGRHDPSEAVDDGDRLHLFPLPSSGEITLGLRDDQELTVPIGGLVVGVVGLGAEACARALLLTLLTHAGDHDVEVLVPRSDAGHLLTLTDDQVDQVAEYVRPLSLVPDLEAALRWLESERIHRARLLDAADEPTDLASIRRADATEPLPRLVLLATCSPEQQRRLEAACASADLYDMAVILLGEHPAGPTLHLDERAHVTTITRTDPAQAPQWDGLHLFHLSEEDTQQTLEVIRSAHGAPEPKTDQSAANRASAAAQPDQVIAHPQAPVRLRVLGPPTLIVDGRELATGMRGKARELLAYLADAAEGAPRDMILETLWPEVDQQHAVMRFHAAVNDVRRELRRATGLSQEDFIILAAVRYRLDPNLISVDLWELRAALRQATRSDNPSERVEHLRRATGIYQGHFAAEHSYEWIEPRREALRRQSVETVIHLADLNEDDDPERALTALEQAQEIDRYTEEIYQKIMTLQARLGRYDAVRRTHRLLETNLEDIGVDPSDETQELFWRLLNPRARSRGKSR